MKSRLPLLAVVLAVVVVACGHSAGTGAGATAGAARRTGGKTGPAPAPGADATGPPEEPRDGMKVSGTLGDLDQDQVEETFRAHLEEINRCYQDVSARIWYLSGRVVVKVRIADQIAAGRHEGTVRAATISESTLGNYEIERCVLQVAQKLSFPPPRGGEAEFTYPVQFPVRSVVMSWPEDRVAGELRRHRGEIFGCRAPARGRLAGPKGHLRLTMYIGPGGRVTSAGLSAEGPIDDKVASCLVSRAQGWRFEDPMGQMVKTSCALD